MEWLGGKIKYLIKENNSSIVKLAEKTGVSRQTVTDWIKGQVPKGNHLINLCKIFNVNPDFFFSKDFDNSISVPVHRTRRTAKVTSAMQKDALEMARTYEVLFKNDANSSVLPVVRVHNRTDEIAKKIAKELRKRAGLSQDIPPDYEHTFSLLAYLGIKVIFRYFPEKIKAYAYYTKIHGHRIVFVNNSTNIIDLIFPILHEAVHAIRDEIKINDGFDAEEENFCDKVASYIQFPDEYVHIVYDFINGLPVGVQVNKLKTFGKKYGHALFGIVKQIKTIDPDFNLKIGGADSNFKKGFHTIGDIIFIGNDPRDYVAKISTLSPLFTSIILNQIDSITNRKLGEMLGIESVLDTKAVKDELIKLKSMAS
ncbi:MAG: ImmA/IrrE family metallo-endopeptidase [Desulfobacteraceae bacterium]|uniref:ImmA/IrrE family metallo-endopeptidase n=1 Tax=Candidatus Desulfaltia bathyphila TaxID=2841697 RepID=A0A8J6N532_9BACT|nr:ImmA/IrrE family metallo-endopeptidase [Candidatus Desulfaltia bathyphila]